ncbi:hypothetical protein BDV18DRAFT_156847 [Aspergillus unguis]
METWRTSQRLPRRCTECARRRVRCDKKAPCGQCVARDCAHLCMREVVCIRGKLAVATPAEEDHSNLLRENAQLRDRVSELELALTLNLQHQVGVRASNNQRLVADEHMETHERMGAILDDWSMGVMNRSSKASSSGLEQTGRSDGVQHIPDGVTSSYIVRFSLETLGWIHCAVRADQVMQEHAVFVECLANGDMTVLENHGWMAIYFSLLTVGLLFMEREQASALPLNGINDGFAIQGVCETWYHCAFRQLDLANAIGTPQLQTIQAAAILTLCNSHFGQVFRETNLTSIAINSARALNMHRLGSESSYPNYIESMPEWTTREDREMGRRLWWTITICDWLSTMSRRPPSIHPMTFDTEIKPGHFDSNIILNGLSISDGNVLSPLLHHIALSKVARRVYDYTQAVKKSSAVLSQFLQQLRELEHEFISQIDRLICSFESGVNKSRAVPPWVYGQKAHYLCTLNFIRLTLSRILSQPSLPNLPIISQIRTCADEAAMHVVDLGHVPQVIFGSATIAAGIFFCLDLLISNPECDPQRRLHRRQAVQSCIDALLPHAHKTKICSEGPKALQWLLELETRQQGKGCEEIVNAILNTWRPASSDTSILSPSLLQGQEYSPNSTFVENPWSTVSTAPFFEELDFDWLFNSIAF